MDAFGRTAHSYIYTTGNVVMLCDISKNIPLFLHFGRVIIWPVLVSNAIHPKLPEPCIPSDASESFVRDQSELDPHRRGNLQPITVVMRWDLFNLRA